LSSEVGQAAWAAASWPLASPESFLQKRLRRIQSAHYESVYRQATLVVDLLIVSLIGFGWLALRFQTPETAVKGLGIAYWLVVAGLVPVWCLMLALVGTYDRRLQTYGPEEYRRVIGAGIRLLAAVAITSYAFRAQLARSLVLVALPLVVFGTVAGRYTLRQGLRWLQRRGQCLRRVLVIGSVGESSELIRHVRRAPYTGLMVVGACVPGDPGVLAVDGTPVPVLSHPDRVLEVVKDAAIDTIAVAGSSGPDGWLRGLTWNLEGSGIEVLVAPTITDVAGPRVAVRRVDGLPLLHVEEPSFTGGRRVLKDAVERLAAVVSIILLLPLWAAIALGIWRSGPGPIFFAQERVGHGGRKFHMLKFRTMRNGSERELNTLLDRNERDGPMFKLRRDPRVTAIGRWLRRFSLDELPQLWNVLTGEMSLVGPRPPLPREVDAYPGYFHRRFLVKPGITGLWQIRGRSELTWQESIRLDLYYVENWSLELDAYILWKTIFAVLNRRGAY
jgi:exopolysaccharide biosynthesis polyprenyl glycosylphosphotransferase